jgi:quercetin dioxygenase-like cupin family protein
MDVDGGMRRVAAGTGTPLAVHHHRFHVKVGAWDTSGELLVLETVVAPGTGAGLHRHPAREVFDVLDGRFDFRTLSDGRVCSIAATAGDVVDVPPDVPHGYTNVGAEAGRLFCLFTPGGTMQRFFEAVDDLVTRRPDLAVGTAAYSAASRRVAMRHGVVRVEVPGG